MADHAEPAAAAGSAGSADAAEHGSQRGPRPRSQADAGADYAAYGVTKRFGDVTVLHNVTAHFFAGEIHSIIFSKPLEFTKANYLQYNF